MTKTFKILLLTISPIVIICLFLLNFNKPEPPHIIKEKLDNYLSEYEAKGFNGMIWAEKNGEIILKKAYGFANKGNGTEMTLEHGFSMGSIVKHFTRMSIRKLANENKLKMSDNLTKFFDNVPYDKRKIKISQLMEHKAGLSDYLDSNGVGDDSEIITKEEALKRIMERPLVNKPGKKRQYSNAGFSLLAIIIEKVSNQTYEDYVLNNFLKPKGLNKTGYIMAPWDKSSLVIGYEPDGSIWGTSKDIWSEDGPSWVLKGNGGMLTNISELRQIINIIAEDENINYLGTAGGNGIFNVAIEWDVKSKSGIIIMSSNGKYIGEKIMFMSNEGKALLNKVL